jgi:L-iditol 2-dehydrogenase
MQFAIPGLVRVPRRNSLEEASMLEPVNTVLKAVRRLSLLKNDSVLVVGQGPIGLLFTRLLRIAGAKVVATDLIDQRLALARHWGASAAFHRDAKELTACVDRLTRGRGLDAAIVTAPSDAAVQQAHRLVRGAGQVLVFAHTHRGRQTQIDLSAVCVDEKDLLGSYSSDLTLQEEVARLVFSGAVPVKGLITHRFPLERTAEAVQLACCPAPNSLKILVLNELSECG